MHTVQHQHHDDNADAIEPAPETRRDLRPRRLGRLDLPAPCAPDITAQVDGALTEAGYVRLVVRAVDGEPWAAVTIDAGEALAVRTAAVAEMLRGANYDVIEVGTGRLLVGLPLTLCPMRRAA